MTARNDTTQRTPGLWRVEYDNDTGPDDEGFDEWWTVYDGERVVGWFSSEEEAQAIASVPTLRSQNAALVTCIKGILGALDQPVTRRLRRENSIFNGDMLCVEHFAADALKQAGSEDDDARDDIEARGERERGEVSR